MTATAVTVILVCGGRDYRDARRVAQELSHLRSKYRHILVVQGGAFGADRLAREWCMANNVAFVTVDAHWAKYGPSAGPMRNKAMLKYKPALVLAFPGGRGTANMITQAQQAGVPVQIV